MKKYCLTEKGKEALNKYKPIFYGLLHGLLLLCLISFLTNNTTYPYFFNVIGAIAFIAYATIISYSYGCSRGLKITSKNDKGKKMEHKDA